MITPLSITSPLAIESIAPAASASPARQSDPFRPGDPFGQVLQQAIGDVTRFQEQAAQSAGRFLSGESEEIHQVAIDAQRAELAFDLFLQARNKVVDAYQEIMRMQL